MSEWGKGVINNNIGWGQGFNNSIDWGAIYANSYTGETIISEILNLQSIINKFKTRVSNDGGTFEAESNLLSILTEVNNSIVLSKINNLLTPNAFKALKGYSVLGATDFNVLRNTSATRVNTLGLIELVGSNIMRLDYTTGTPFILDEPQRTNLITYSNDLTNASWLKTKGGVAILPVVTANAGLSPEGLQNANRVQLSLNNGTASADLSIIANSAFQASIKAASIYIKTFDGTTKTIVFRISSSGGFAQKTIGPNYTRIAEIGNSDIFQFGLRGTFGTSATADLLIYGCQLEEGNTVSSAIKTEGSAVTRNADVVTISPPAGTVKITTTFLNGSTQVLTSIPALFTVPEGLIKQVLMQSSL